MLSIVIDVETSYQILSGDIKLKPTIGDTFAIGDKMYKVVSCCFSFRNNEIGLHLVIGLKFDHYIKERENDEQICNNKNPTKD